MKYTNKKWSHAVGDTQAYRDNYDNIDWTDRLPVEDDAKRGYKTPDKKKKLGNSKPKKTKKPSK